MSETNGYVDIATKFAYNVNMMPVYDDGTAQLYHGDCTVVLPTLSQKADLILTSPPYDNLRKYGGNTFDFTSVADACINSMAEGGILVWIVADATIDGDETGSSFRQALYFKEHGLVLHDTMIYRKLGGPASGTKTRHKNGFEYMFVFSNGKPKTVRILEDKITKYPEPDRQVTRRQPDGTLEYGPRGVVPEVTLRDNVWEYSPGFRKSAENPIAHNHPAIFHIALAKDHIRTWTAPGDLVIDPMVGSGTTMRAAKDLNRLAIGIEIHSDYIDVIKERVSQQVMDVSEVDDEYYSTGGSGIYKGTAEMDC